MEANQNNNQNESTPHHDEHHFQNKETAELAKKSLQRETEEVEIEW